jgi:DNA-binding NarL/FixJ family response regulator
VEKTIRIVVAQGHCLLRSALVERLEREEGIEVCAVSSDVRELQELIFTHRPHVLLINISLKCSSGMASLKKLKHDFFGLGVLAFACDSEFEGLCADVALRSGADGYVSFVDTPENLVRAIHLVRCGGQYISSGVELTRKGGLTKEVCARLSRREAEVFCLTGCGHVPKSIAEMMNVSVKTIESYRERIRAKMNLSDGAALLYSSVRFMRLASGWSMDGKDEHLIIRALLSARA